MRLDECSDHQADVLREIIPLLNKIPEIPPLLKRLPKPLTAYTAAIGAIREQEFNIPSRKRQRG
jgi:hypothetical protein